MGVGGLRVWNDDEIAPGTGFDPHPHREMEIITYVRQGAITHQDSLGNDRPHRGGRRAGDARRHRHRARRVQPGDGADAAVPDLDPAGQRGVAPGWGTRSFPKQGAGSLTALADGRPGADGSALPLYADAAVLAGTLAKGQTVEQKLRPGRVAYLVPATGAVTVNGVAVNTRDGATISGETELRIVATEEAEVVLVDVVG